MLLGVFTSQYSKVEEDSFDLEDVELYFESVKLAYRGVQFGL